MKTKIQKDFDSVAFFRAVKLKLSKQMKGMSINQKQVFMRQIREENIQVLGK